MQYSEPEVRIERVPNNLEQYIRELAETETFEYALIAHSGDSSFHNDLKLFERDTEMIIQGIQIKVFPSLIFSHQLNVSFAPFRQSRKCWRKTRG
jgi:hypothetical protein